MTSVKHMRLSLSVLAIVFALAPQALAQAQMPNPKEMSGAVLPVSDIPAGTVSVRVIRGGFDKNVTGQSVEFTVDGKPRVEKTDENGRAQVAGLRSGARVRAVAVVDGERLESQEAVVGTSGLRIILVATDPEAVRREEEDKRLATLPAVKGMVVLGPESRIIAEMSDDRLNVFYILDVINSARTPVDIGGPLIFDLPREARGATILEGSSPQATANGPRVTITGPFAPGSTMVQAAYELPYSGGTARLDQTWPAALQQLTVLVPQIGGLDVVSAQIATKRQMQDQGGQQLIVASGPGLAAGQALSLVISGLPHHPAWPRNVALALAAAIAGWGIWAAVFTTPRRHAA